MSSVIHFKMVHGRNPETISFTGHQIKLIDLKRAILEKKNISAAFDFDFRISYVDNPSAG